MSTLYRLNIDLETSINFPKSVLRTASMPKTQDNQTYFFSAVFHPGETEEDALEFVPKLKKQFKQHFDKWIFQLERGERKGKLHFQIFCHVKTKTRSQALGRTLGSDFPGIDFRPCSAKGKDALKRYCMKEDTRVQGPWASASVYTGRDLPTELFPWQKSVKNTIVDHPPDRRKIYWFYDKAGGSGKSTFAKYMFFHHQVITITFGDAKDLLHLVSKFPGRKAYLFDLSRTKGGKTSMSDIYQALEAIKNGYFCSTKYDSSYVAMDIPHVFVFSNHFPKVDALSYDRWVIVDLSKVRANRAKRYNVQGDEALSTSRQAPEEPNPLDTLILKKGMRLALDGQPFKKKRKVARIPLEEHTPSNVWNLDAETQMDPQSPLSPPEEASQELQEVPAPDAFSPVSWE